MSFPDMPLLLPSSRTAVIAEEVLQAELNQEPVPSLPSIENLAQAANRYR